MSESPSHWSSLLLPPCRSSMPQLHPRHHSNYSTLTSTQPLSRERHQATPLTCTHTHTQIIMNPHTEDGLVSSCTQRSPRLRHKSSLSHGPCIFSPRTFRFMTPPRRTTASVITTWVLAPSTFCCRSKHGMRRKVKTTHGVGRIKQVLC